MDDMGATDGRGMGNNTGRDPLGTADHFGESNGHTERTVVRDGGGFWELPPIESCESEVRVPVSVPEGTAGWLTPPLGEPTVIAASGRDAHR
jgi:hypothetical protein